jgi:Domain of unknown function (DUF5666)
LTPLEPIPAPKAPRGPRWRLAALTGATLVLLGSAAITMAASPEPSTSPDPDVTVQPNRDGSGLFRGMKGLGGLGLADGFAGMAGRHGGFGVGNITITAIDGSSVSLETVDGWTRTIEVSSTTEITKDGDAITLADLEVGDRIRFRQTVDDDGNYTVTAIAVVVPSVVGQVTAVDGDSITLSQPDGSAVTVHVNGSTEFTVAGETGKAVSDIEVGMIVAASGEQRDDGSIDATRIRAGTIWQGLGRGHGRGPWLNPDGAAPSATPDDSSGSSS